MTEFEFDRLCDQQVDCDGKCMRCAIFAKYYNSQEK